MAPKKTAQSSLDSFFGGKGASTSKPKNSQKKIESFFGASSSKKDKVKGTEQKENTNEELATTDSPTAVSKVPPSKRKSPDEAVPSGDDQKKAVRKRRVIQDDSSDEEEAEFEGGSNKVAAADLKKDASTKEQPSKDDEVMEDVDPSPTTAPSKAKSEKSPAAKESKESSKPATVNKPAKDSKSKTNNDSASKSKTKDSASKSAPAAKSPAKTDSPSNQTRPKSSLVKLGKFKTDETLLAEITSEDWDKCMPYAVLCNAFEKIEAVTSRLAIQEIMTTLFRQIMLKTNQDMATVLYLASNSVAAAYECVELGIGDSLLIKAIGEAYGTNPKLVKEKYESIGDLGSVAQSCKSKQKSLGSFFAVSKKTSKNFLSATEILETFREIAKTKGNQSQKWKVEMIKKLLVRVTDPAETRYIIRGLQGKLRIGLAQSTVLISLAHALALTIPTTIDAKENKKTKPDDDYPDEAKQYMSKDQPVEKRMEAAVAIIKKAYSEVPSYEAILDAALKVPLFELHKACTLTPGIPVAPMLAKPTKSVQEVLKRLNGLKFTCEYKYDGERAQIHMLSDGTTKVFSRNLLDTSEKYPEVPAFVKEACTDVQSFVLDAEVVAFNRETGQLVPFQVLSTRKKTEESAETAKVQVIVQAFDLMYLNEKSLLSHTLAERRALMKKHFVPVEGKFQFAKFLDHEENGDTTVLEEFLDAAVKGQCEGLMVKTLEVNAIYEPSRRSLNWLKLKKDYLEGLGDSVDLVPLGAYHGRGKRTGVYGAYLLACYDTDAEEFQSVCKIGTGFSDEDLKTLSDSLNAHKIPTKSSQYNVADPLECDVWFDATQVWEVKAADLSKSSLHRGADGKTGEAGRGIGLRFPRFERLRDDKRPEEATTSDQILEMYYQQDAITGGDAEDDDDGGI